MEKGRPKKAREAAPGKACENYCALDKVNSGQWQPRRNDTFRVLMR